MISLTRRYRFSASHRLHTGSLSDDENRRLYGKCNHPYGHGHDYRLEVTVAGPLDPVTGQLIRLPELDRLVEDKVLRDFDHKHLNEDVPEFATLVPTSENVALVIERRLNENWKDRFRAGGPRIENVRLYETARNRFELR